MAQINVNPDKVDELIRRFYQHNDEIKNRQAQMNAYLTQMQHYWNDSHYQAFKQQFEEYHKLILKANEMAESLLLPNLKNIKKFAESYKNLR
jgi:uncharacterized protein YukE